jgi:protein-L-isoaspartate O-methyltransferase
MVETMTDFAAEREAMVERQIASRGIREPTILEAFRSVPREELIAKD